MDNNQDLNGVFVQLKTRRRMGKQRKMNGTLRLNNSDNQVLKSNVGATVISTAYGDGRLVGWDLSFYCVILRLINYLYRYLVENEMEITKIWPRKCRILRGLI